MWTSSKTDFRDRVVVGLTGSIVVNVGLWSPISAVAENGKGLVCPGATKFGKTDFGKSLDVLSGRDNQSATLFSLPGMCLILKSKDCKRARHRHTIGDKLASIHWRLRWSVSTRNSLPRKYHANECTE